MKYWFLAAAISLGIAQQPGKTPTGTAPKGNSSHVTSPTAANSKADPSSPASAAVSAASSGPSDTLHAAGSATDLNTNAGLQTKLTWFIEALAVVAALQFATLLWQGIAIRKMLGRMNQQAYETEYQHTVMDEQLKILTEQVKALQDTASAASASAAAARENVDLIVKKERARLRIELAPFHLNFEAPSPAHYVVQHQGSTDAYVIDSQAHLYVSDSREPYAAPGDGKPMPLPHAITPQSPVVMAQDVLHPCTEEEIENVRQRKSFVHFSGFVRYKDVFDGEHETRFNRVWSIAKMNHLGDEPFTYWERCGGEDENRET